jgi:hypothetical protein
MHIATRMALPLSVRYATKVPEIKSRKKVLQITYNTVVAPEITGFLGASNFQIRSLLESMLRRGRWGERAY